ncbi:hypothetical protein JCM13664_19450 [Methylothermus subterraneus]
MSVNVAAELGKILYMQAAALIVVCLGGLAGFGWQVAKSAGLGGLIAFLPNAYFALKVSQSQGKTPQQIVRGFYLGEAVKLGLVGVLFFLALRTPGVRFVALLIGFIAVLSVFWVALLLSEQT